jgi:hypothetical protein
MHSCIAEQIYMQHAKHAISSFFIFISILFIFISNPLGMYFVFPLIFLLLYFYFIFFIPLFLYNHAYNFFHVYSFVRLQAYFFVF